MCYVFYSALYLVSTKGLSNISLRCLNVWSKFSYWSKRYIGVFTTPLCLLVIRLLVSSPVLKLSPSYYNRAYFGWWPLLFYRRESDFGYPALWLLVGDSTFGFPFQNFNCYPPIITALILDGDSFCSTVGESDFGCPSQYLFVCFRSVEFTWRKSLWCLIASDGHCRICIVLWLIAVDACISVYLYSLSQ
jgi:hypothetical protein